MLAQEAIVWAARISYALVCDRGVSKQELVAELPTPEQCCEWSQIGGASCFHMLTQPLLVTALVCERYGLYDSALAYLTAALDREPSQGGHAAASARIRANCARGRVLASRGAIVSAEVAYEAAYEEAERVEYWLLCALALKELTKHCGQRSLNQDRAVQGRLDLVLKKLKSSEDSIEDLKV
eukprot:SAG11_NODE_990_length_6270_cov_38.630044_8_plen_182_part_00